MISATFVTAGRAVFTADSPKGQHFTFKVRKKEMPAKGQFPARTMFFVSARSAQRYEYVGVLDARTGVLRATRGSKFGDQSQVFKVAFFVLARIWQQRDLPDGYTVKHEGKCGRCARRLTDPVSIDMGIGPDCAEQMGLTRRAA